MGKVFKLVGFIICVFMVLGGSFGILQAFTGGAAGENQVIKLNDVNVSKDSLYADIYYIEEVYIIERYAAVYSRTTSDIDGGSEYIYNVDGTQSYPSGDSGFFDVKPNFEIYTALFYDSTGTAYIISLTNTLSEEISIQLGNAGGEPVKMSVYASRCDTADDAGKDYASEVRELKDASFKKCADEENAQVVNLDLDFIGQTQDEYEEYTTVDTVLTFILGGIIPFIIGGIGIFVFLSDFVNWLKAKFKRNN